MTYTFTLKKGSSLSLQHRATQKISFTHTGARPTNIVKSVNGRIGDVTGLAEQADVDALQDELDGKQPVGEYATDVELSTGLATKAPLVHTHTEAEITDLDKYTQGEVDALLDTKQPTGDYATNTALSTGLATKADVTSIPVITGKADTEYVNAQDAALQAGIDTKASKQYVDTQDASVASTAQANLTAHTSNTSNPHATTKAQVGLGNVDNTSDVNKPVSTAQQTALNGKVTQLNTASRIYATGSNGLDTSLAFSQGIDTGSIAQRSTNGTLAVGVPTSAAHAARKDYVDGLVPIKGTGFPNGVVTANVGSIYIDTAVTNGASSWIKKSGAGNTGWSVLEGDTGWRLIVEPSPSRELFIRREGATVYAMVRGTTIATGANGETVGAIPDGFKPPRDVPSLYTQPASSTPNKLITYYTSGAVNLWSGVSANTSYSSLSQTYATNQSWPSTLPGTPA